MRVRVVRIKTDEERENANESKTHVANDDARTARATDARWAHRAAYIAVCAIDYSSTVRCRLPDDARSLPQPCVCALGCTHCRGIPLVKILPD